ncbi:MAG: sugar transferase [Candidatus Margulisiibacteriota bacterium]
MAKKTFTFNLLLMAFDILAINISFILGDCLKRGYFDPPLLVAAQNSRLLIFATATLLAIFSFFKLYDQQAKRSEVDEAGAAAGALTFGMVLFEFMTLFYRDMIFRRLTIFYAWLFALVLIITFRIFLILLRKWLYKRGVGVSNILIIGTGEDGRLLMQKIKNHPEMGLRIAGFLRVENEPGAFTSEGMNVLGGTNDLENLIVKLGINSVIFAVSDAPNNLIMELVEKCELNKAEFRFVPRVLDIIESRVSSDEVVGVPLITVKEIKLYGLNALLKRTSDIVYSFVLLVFVLPVIGIIALAIKLDSAGSMFFVQRRVGAQGKEFNMYKFRSMRADAEADFGKVAGMNEADGLIFKMKNDPRVTRVGRFLRKWSLDELPQIFNVIKGDMSFVGPRPPLPSEVRNYNSWHKKRLRIAPGITGLWQVSGRSDVSFDEMVKLDIYYIESWSLWQDVKILMKTVPVVLLAKGAY